MSLYPPIIAQEILYMKLESNDAGATTIREYLVKLLEMVWEEGEGFDGKRPFGNSGWEMDLLIPLAESGFISGHKDEESGEWDLDYQAYQAGTELISKAINSLV